MERNKAGQAQRYSEQTRRIENPEAKRSIEEIQNKYGFVPQYLSYIADHGVVGHYERAKKLIQSADTALHPRTKNLIGLAVASVIPCKYTTYAEREYGRINGMTEYEEKEALIVAAVVRHWSTYANGIAQDQNAYKKEAEQIAKRTSQIMSEDAAARDELGKILMTRVETAEEAYKDIDKTLGLIPEVLRRYPAEAIAGAWMELKWVQINPYSAIHPREKELIAAAVASQIPCQYYSAYHKELAQAYGATEREINEAIAIAATIRHSSALLYGANVDLNSYQKDTQRILETLGKHRAI